MAGAMQDLESSYESSVTINNVPATNISLFFMAARSIDGPEFKQIPLGEI
jgi:hypothetical protein